MMIDRVIVIAAKRVELIADNPEKGKDIRIKAHLLFGEFHLITNPGRGRRTTKDAKKDLLTRMNDLISEAEGAAEPEPDASNAANRLRI